MSAPGFYRPRPEDGVICCALCGRPNHAHTARCPVLTLRTQLRELTGSLGLLVATMRETLDAFNRLLRGEAGDGPEGDV